MKFVDVTKEAGLSGFRLVSGNPTKDYIIESLSAGVAFLDIDNDGWLDVYLINGSTLEDKRAGRPGPPNGSIAIDEMAHLKTSQKNQARESGVGGWVFAPQTSTATVGSTFT